VIKAGSTYATRTKELLKVKGTLINPEIMKNELANIEDVTEYQIVVSKKDAKDPYSMDELIIKIAPTAGADLDSLRQVVTDKVRLAAEISPKVQFVRMADIFDPATSLKAQRVVDLRTGE